MRRKKRKRRRRGASPLFVMNSGPRGPWPKRAAVVVGVEPWGAQETSLTHPLTYNCNSASSWPPEHNGREWAGGHTEAASATLSNTMQRGRKKNSEVSLSTSQGERVRASLLSFSLFFFLSLLCSPSPSTHMRAQRMAAGVCFVSVYVPCCVSKMHIRRGLEDPL